MNKNFKSPFALSLSKGSCRTVVRPILYKAILLLFVAHVSTYARRLIEPESHDQYQYKHTSEHLNGRDYQYAQTSEHLNGRDYQYDEETLGVSAGLDANQSFAHSMLPETAIARERRELPLIHIFKDKDLFKFRFTGYVKNVTFGDTRQVIGFADNYILFTPRIRKLDPCGKDINADGQFNMVPFETRLLLYILGPNILDARTFARVEGDFITDFSEVLTNDSTEVLLQEDIEILNRLRLRHAYFSLDWEKVQLLVGQTWHPYNYPIESPDTISFNTGGPIEPLARNPQIRLVVHSKYWELMLTMLSERDFPSLGPFGFNSIYSRDSRTPNFNALVRFFCKGHTLGIDFNFKRLVPRIETNKGFKTREAINSMAGMAYANFHFDHFDMYIKATYAEDGSNFGMIGGYAVHCIDPVTDRRTYANLGVYSVWSELIVRKPISPALFVGYIKNVGSNKTIMTSIPGTGICEPDEESLIYSFLPRINHLFRVSPRVKWDRLPLSIGAEIEYTRSVFGEIGPMGNVINLQEPVSNTRFLFSMVYFF